MTRLAIRAEHFIDAMQLMQISEQHHKSVFATVAPRVYQLRATNAHGSNVATAFAYGEHGFLMSAGHNSQIKVEGNQELEVPDKYEIVDSEGNVHEATCELCLFPNVDRMLFKCDAIVSRHRDFLASFAGRGHSLCYCCAS
jgi:hypothetical protein